MHEASLGAQLLWLCCAGSEQQQLGLLLINRLPTTKHFGPPIDMQFSEASVRPALVLLLNICSPEEQETSAEATSLPAAYWYLWSRQCGRHSTAGVRLFDSCTCLWALIHMNAWQLWQLSADVLQASYRAFAMVIVLQNWVHYCVIDPTGRFKFMFDWSNINLSS